jgi:AAA family ATP:ADP antiporter
MSNNLKVSAEKNEKGEEYLPSSPWKKMNTTSSVTTRASEYFDDLVSKVTGNLEGDDLFRVLWLSSTLFFIVGGYWLLRSLKDPIMSVINGVRWK